MGDERQGGVDLKRRRGNHLMKGILAILLTTAFLSGCSIQSGIVKQNVEDGEISGLRTGIDRQGIAGARKSFECTEERVYFMTNLSGVPLLCSSYHGSDIVSPLCTVPGCKHDGTECEAFFKQNGNVCYYDGYLFVDSGSILYRLNLDGTGRKEIINITNTIEGDYDGIAEPRLWNGVFTFYLTKMTQTIDDIHNPYRQIYYDPYYFKLDGSMKKPEPMDNLVAQYNDGNSFIMRGPAGEGSTENWLLYTWDAQTNTSEFRFEYTDIAFGYYTPLKWLPDEEISYFDFTDVNRRYESFSEGYWGTDCAYYLVRDRNPDGTIQDNVMYKWNYTDNKPEEFLRTGLTGAYKLTCFPDCFILIETISEVSARNGTIAYAPQLYFYNWNKELVGQYDFNTLLGEDGYLGVHAEDIICGETAERIYLATQYLGVPDYYIDKADFETGEIKLHKLKYEGINLD